MPSHSLTTNSSNHLTDLSHHITGSSFSEKVSQSLEFNYWSCLSFFSCYYSAQSSNSIKKHTGPVLWKMWPGLRTSKCFYLGLWILLSYAKMTEHSRCSLVLLLRHPQWQQIRESRGPVAPWPCASSTVPVLASDGSIRSGPVTTLPTAHPAVFSAPQSFMDLPVFQAWLPRLLTQWAIPCPPNRCLFSLT